MPYHSKTSPTDLVFGALANPIRRDIMDMLLAGPRSLQEIAANFDMTRQSVSEHVKVLIDAGLLREEAQGRYRYYFVQGEPLHHLARWLTPYEELWRERLGALRSLLDERAAEEDAAHDLRGASA